MKRRNRSIVRTILSSPISLLFALVILFLVGRAALDIKAKADLVSERLEEARAGISRLKDNERRLERQLAGISTEEGMIAEIRSKFHAVEPGESVAVIINNEASQKLQAGDSATSTASSAEWEWWRKLLRLFGR